MLLGRAPPLVFELLWKSFLAPSRIRTHRDRYLQATLAGLINEFTSGYACYIFLASDVTSNECITGNG